MHGVAHCLGTNQGLKTPSWAPKERVSKDHKYPKTIWFFPEDVSNLHL